MNENNIVAPLEPEQNMSELLKIRRDKLNALQESGNDPYMVNTCERDISNQEIRDRFEELENKDVCIAGRIMSWRDMGKARFIDLHDRTGKMQIYIKIDDVGEDTFKAMDLWDIGDMLCVKGFVFRTRRGEISVHAKALELISKSLLPLPEKFHGLKDTDTRYRQRYVDLIVNPDVKDTFIKRSEIIKTIRKFLDTRGFIEVETPILNTIPGGAAARPFITHHNTLDMDMYLRIAPELYLKRLIVGGLEKVYEIGRLFRNEGMSIKHNPEFTTIELYEAYTDYHGMMDLTENMIHECALKVCGTDKISYQGEEVSLALPFKRMSMLEAVKLYSGIDFDEFKGDDQKAHEVAKQLELEVKPIHTWGDILNIAFEETVEENLLEPTFIYDYPVEVSPLTKRKKDRPELVERFELFMTRRELANAYTELNDPIDQKNRFLRQMALRDAGDDEANMIDDDFVTALEYGMPPTGGMGMGIDRLTMLLTDSASIRDVLLFPTMKPLDSDKKVEKAVKTASKVEEESFDEDEITNLFSFNIPYSKSDEMPLEQLLFGKESKLVIEPLFEDCVDFETFSKSDFRAVKVLECEAVPKSKKLLKFTLDDGTGVNRTILSGIHAYYEPEDLIGKTCIAITNLPPRAMMGIESCGMLLSAVNKRGEDEELNLLMVDPHIPAGAKLY